MSKEYNLNNILSTGNPIANVLGGALFGAAEAGNKKGKYYVRANYKGNGLADTGIAYMANPNYKSMSDGAQMVSALFKRNKGDSSSNSILQKLQALVNTKQNPAPYTLQGELKNPPYSGYGQYNLPYNNYKMPDVSYNYDNLGNNYGQYQLPVQGYGQLDFNRWR